MFFNLDKWVSYITESAMKQITDAFGQRLKKNGITRIQWIALYYIDIHKSISQRELSLLMNIKDSSVGRLLDRMERDEIIIRHRSETDRRVVFVSLSKHGEDLNKILMPIGQQFNNDLIKGLTEEELHIFHKVIENMTKNVIV